MGCHRIDSQTDSWHYISRHRNMLITEAFLRTLVQLYGRHVVLYIQMEMPNILKHVLLWVLLHLKFENRIIESYEIC
jgi:hypothetical protein